MDDPKPEAEALWNWKNNIDGGKKLLDTKIAAVRIFYNGCLKDVYQWNKDHPDNRIEGHSNQTEGDITFTHASSSISGLSKTDIKYSITVTNEDGVKETIVTDMGDTQTACEKSFIDATLIKYYNGGYYYRLKKFADITKVPEWQLDQTSKITVKDKDGNDKIIDINYVEKVCSESE